MPGIARIDLGAVFDEELRNRLRSRNMERPLTLVARILQVR